MRRGHTSRRRDQSDGLLKAGLSAPDFGFGDEGMYIRLSSLRDRSNVLLIACADGLSAACQEAARAVRADWRQLRSRDVISVILSQAPEHALQDFSRDERIPCVLISDEDGRVLSLYGADRRESPVVYLIDKSGIIRARWTGWPSTRPILVSVGTIEEQRNAA